MAPNRRSCERTVLRLRKLPGIVCAGITSDGVAVTLRNACSMITQTEGFDLFTEDALFYTRVSVLPEKCKVGYAAGLPPRAIAAQLNQEGIPSPRGGFWNASTINGSRQRRNGILNNQLYLGRITYNRQRFVKDPDTGKRVSRPNPEGLWIVKEVPELRIIEDATWEAAHGLRQRYSSQAGNKRQTRKRLLSGLIRCGGCGGAMTIVIRAPCGQSSPNSKPASAHSSAP